MPNLFPDILYLGPVFAPFLLRLALGLPFIASAYLLLKKKDVPLGMRLGLGGAQGVTGILLVIGLFVQPAAIAAIVLTIIARVRNPITSPWQRILLTVGVALALIILGAGAYAFDSKLI